MPPEVARQVRLGVPERRVRRGVGQERRHALDGVGAGAGDEEPAAHLQVPARQRAQDEVARVEHRQVLRRRAAGLGHLGRQGGDAPPHEAVLERAAAAGLEAGRQRARGAGRGHEPRPDRRHLAAERAVVARRPRAGGEEQGQRGERGAGHGAHSTPVAGPGRRCPSGRRS
ncbi:MAG: hypothetical protein KF878_03260 [Planctomycetes bacterium]|nr:hypothetical protein [Planctomycetota bacterium]